MIRAFNVLALLVTAVLAVALYSAKTEAQAARARVVELQKDLQALALDIRVLKAEIAHLENPTRLAILAREHLGLTPFNPAQEVALEDLPSWLASEGGQ